MVQYEVPAFTPNPAQMVPLKIEGIVYTYMPSTRANKKLMVTIRDGKSSKTIHFGDSRYQHYFDRTRIWAPLDHRDPQRREKYHTRHGSSSNPLTAAYHADRVLW